MQHIIELGSSSVQEANAAGMSWMYSVRTPLCTRCNGATLDCGKAASVDSP